MPVSTIDVLDGAGVTRTVNAANSNGQALMVASRPVVIASDQSAVPVSGTVTANVSTITTVSTVTNLAQFGGSAINLGAGAVGTGTLRITQASDSPLVTAMGAIADAAWTTGSGSVIALLKAIAGNATSNADSPVETHQPCDVISFTPTLDTAAYASGDVLFATAAITGVTRANDLRSVLSSLTVIDKSKQAPAFTLLFYQTNVTSAAANAANALSDADQINCLGFVSIAAADYLTFANNSVLCYSGAKAPNLMLEAATGTTTVYVVGILQAGTPTFAVGDLVLKFGFVQQ